MVKQQDTYAAASDQLLGVWMDLERALEGTNGYGGDVAEIYAYRCVPPQLADLGAVGAPEDSRSTMASVAGCNLSRLLRQFVDLHVGVEVGIEVEREQFRAFDPREEIMPFSHRIHLRVRRTASAAVRRFGQDLRALRERAYVDDVPRWPATVTWFDATDALLRAIGGRKEVP